MRTEDSGRNVKVRGSRFEVRGKRKARQDKTFYLFPSNLEPRTSNLEPRTSNLEPRTLSSVLSPPPLPIFAQRAAGRAVVQSRPFENAREQIGDAPDEKR